MSSFPLLEQPSNAYVFPCDAAQEADGANDHDSPDHFLTSIVTLSPPVTRCPEAWRSLAAGCFQEALHLSEVNNDVVCIAASLVMCGEIVRAINTMEAYIIATCVVAHERYMMLNETEDYFIRRLSEVMVAWMSGPRVAFRVMKKSARATDEGYRRAVLDTCNIVNWDTVHRWFLIALFLYEGDYKPPAVAWFRHYFALFTDTSQTLFRRAAPPQQVKSTPLPEQDLAPPLLTRNETEDILLSQCGMGDISFISAVTAWKTKHYRSAITSATYFLGLEESGYEITDPDMRVMACFIRCMSFIQIGERDFAASDAVFLLHSEDDFTSIVGASIAVFVLPMPECFEMFRNYNGPIGQRRYVYALCEYIHALTLLQLGCMEAAVKIIQNTFLIAPETDMGERLLDLLVVACTALEDSTTLLKAELSAEQQLYLAMAPVFFGGFGRTYVKLHTITPAGRLLYPKEISTYASVRQMLPFYMNRAHCHFDQAKYIAAWENVCLAVSCAEEIIGSVEFAFTECSPLNVYYFGCCVGTEVLNTLLGVMTTKGAVTQAGTSTITAALLTQEGDLLGEEVLRKCSEWTQRIRQFHPHVRLGSIALAQYRTISRSENFISRAICLAQRYPRSVLAQNCLTIALYANHHIPEAVDQAERTLQMFPHSREVVMVHRAVAQRDGVYVFNYRTLFPVRYAPCSQRVWTKRTILVIILLFVNFAIFIMTLVVNVSDWVVYPESVKEIAVRLQLPFMFPLSYSLLAIVYATLAAISPHNLVRTILHDLFFINTRLNCFLFPMRGLPFVNMFNALQITIAGNNFLFDSHWYTFLLYVILTWLFIPFTSRVWFLTSLDEPRAGVWTWLTLFAIDTVTGFLFLVPHIILFAIEPLAFIIYFLFRHVQEPEDNEGVSGRVGKRLLLHQACLEKRSARRFLGSGSRYIYVRLMALLYYQTHPDLTTRYLLRSQMDEDNYRVFPLIDVYERIPTEPINSSAFGNICVQRRNASAEFLYGLRSRKSDDEDEEYHTEFLRSRRSLRRLTAVDVWDNGDTTDDECSTDSRTDKNKDKTNVETIPSQRQDLKVLPSGEACDKRSHNFSQGKTPPSGVISIPRRRSPFSAAADEGGNNKTRSTAKRTSSRAEGKSGYGATQDSKAEHSPTGSCEMLASVPGRNVMSANERCLVNRRLGLRVRLSQLADTFHEELKRNSSNPQNPTSTGTAKSTQPAHRRLGG